jgi:uncharacterized repeat protein (TIGR03803 family)
MEIAVYSFTDGLDAGFRLRVVILDQAANVYGTTEGGGANGKGVVFEVTAIGSQSPFLSSRRRVSLPTMRQSSAYSITVCSALIEEDLRNIC